MLFSANITDKSVFDPVTHDYPSLYGEELLPDSEAFVNSLPRQEHPTKDSLTSVLVTNANNPWDFHVIPKFSNWKMRFEDTNAWMDFYALAESMSMFYESIKIARSDKWKVGQLVAISWIPAEQIIPHDSIGIEKSSLGRANGWYRANIIAKEELETKDDATIQTIVKLYLIDIGKTFTTNVSKMDIANLSSLFMDIPPLAYKCRLFGVSPVYHYWTDEACEKFYKWAVGREGIVNVFDINIESQISACDKPLNDNLLLLSEKEQYYTVDLRVKCDVTDDLHLHHESASVSSPKNIPTSEKTLFESVAEKLIKDCLGHAWNLFPERPWIFKTMGYSSAAAICDYPFRRCDDLNKIKEIEKKRVVTNLHDNRKIDPNQLTLVLPVKNDRIFVKGTNDSNKYCERVDRIIKKTFPKGIQDYVEERK